MPGEVTLVRNTDAVTVDSGSGHHRWTRRGFLAAAGAGALAAGYAVGQDVLPGRAFVYRQLGLDGPDGVIPRVEPGRSVSGSFDSPARDGRRTGWTIAWPPGAQKAPHPLPVAVVLHGRGNTHASAFSPDYLGLDRFLAAAVGRGATPFALASVDGGESYWHDRADGDDAGAMVVDEFLPLLDEQGLDVSRVAFFGWSMGGYGALHLAGLLGPDRVAAATAMSPALWHDFADSNPGAFDDQADFDRATVFGHQEDLAGIPVRIDCGEEDPFCSAARDYVEGFAVRPAGVFEPGSHDVGYWRRMAPAQLRFIADSFSTTRGRLGSDGEHETASP
jgi:S-formylglutathione hydrolase FrmB